MTESINPNTLLPMSLQVDKIQQLKQHQSSQHQGIIAQDMNIKNREKQNKVNSNEESAKALINNEKQGKEKNQCKKRQGEEDGSDSEENKDFSSMKGSYIDVKV